MTKPVNHIDKSTNKKLNLYPIEYEEALIGGLLLTNGRAIDRVFSLIKPDFLSPRIKLIYKACQNVYNRESKLDLLLLHSELDNSDVDYGGIQYLAELNRKSPSASNIESHALIILEKYIKRESINFSEYLAKEIEKNDDIYHITEFGRSFFDKLETIRSANNKPILINPTDDSELPVVLYLNGIPHLHKQSLGIITGQTGIGKSLVCEGIMSAALNKDADNLGFKFNGNRILYLDTEQPTRLLNKRFKRVYLQADKIDQIENDYNNWTNLKYKSTNIIPFSLKGIDQKMFHLEKLVKSIEPSLIIIDNGSDLLNDDIGDPKEANEVLNKIDRICTSFDTTVLMVIHQNIGDTKGKPTGHFGTKAYKRAEMTYKVDYDRQTGIRTYTNDYDNSKQRIGFNSGNSMNFIWREGEPFPVSCKAPEKPKTKTGRKPVFDFENCIRNEMDLQTELTFTELKRLLINKSGDNPKNRITEGTAKNYINKLQDSGIIEKLRSNYRLVRNNNYYPSDRVNNENEGDDIIF